METRLALIEWLDADGQVRQSVPVMRWPATVGRALDCDLVLDDPHVAARHAVLDDDGDKLTLTVGDSVNGVQVARQRLRAGDCTELPAHGAFRIGALHLRVRLARLPLAPEQRFAHVDGGWSTRLADLAWLLAFLAWIAGSNWLDLDPGARWDAYLPVLGAVFLLTAWPTAWGIASKLFRRQFEFAAHLRLLLRYVMAALVLDLAMAAVAYAFSWPWLAHLRGWMQAGVFTALLGAHIQRVLPHRRGAVTATLGAALATGIVIQVALNLQREDRWSDDPYLWTLFGPALRIADADPPQALLDDLGAMKDTLDRHAREDDAVDNDDEDVE